MGELIRRGYETSDAGALTDLMNELTRHSGGHPGWLADEVDSFITALVRDRAADSRMVFTPDGELVAAALVPTPPEGGHRVDVDGGVHPRWQGRGLGRELFGWQLARAGQIHQEAAPHARWEVHAVALTADEAATRLFARSGLTPARYWFDMVADLSAGAAARVMSLPDGLRAVRYDPEYEKALYAAHMEAFADHWGYQRREMAEWLPLTVGSDTFRPELSLVAFDGDEIAGYVLSYDDADPGRLYIGQVGVRRAWRRRGLAGALLVGVLRAASAAGRSRAGLGVDAESPTGAVGVYERAGFTVESRAVTYTAPLEPVGS